ncbi:MAG: hypothetical protein RLZZ450_6403 [Pseudomonadota bacterium]
MSQNSSELSSLDPTTMELLERYGFDRGTFETLRRGLRDGELGDTKNYLQGSLEPPSVNDLVRLPPTASAERSELTLLGQQAIRGGEIAAVVLAGGMATRFGGVVKAAVEVAGGRTFLDLKLDDIGASAVRAGGRVPTLLMTSFATDREVSKLAFAATTSARPVKTFSQSVSLRLLRDGSIYRDQRGDVSLYAPGHGDLPFAIRRSGCLAELRQAGVRHLYMSNVDNLAATFDPAIIGAHLSGNKAITVEVADKARGDKGGAPARVNGVLQIVEGFRFPTSFDQDSIPTFNTNTLLFDLEALESNCSLNWFAVKKKVDGAEVIQFERLVHELTAFLPTQMLAVSREGVDGRFMPVKDLDELMSRRPAIEQLLRQRKIL